MRNRLLLAAALSLAFVTCRGRIPSGSRTTPVILISIDTLRSDHLPAYGYTGVATPHLDALRADSVLYKQAYSHCPLTLPSHTTLLTGKLPAENGVRDNVGFNVDPKIPTLAELLKKNGYETAAAVSAFVLRRDTGISRGFDMYDDEVDPMGRMATIGRVQRDGGETAKVAEQWLDTHGEKPFFLFLHLYEPHTPYTPPEPFKSQYTKQPYDGEIAYVDQIVGNFLDHLKQRGLYDKAMIVLLSDHGEGLNDHGEEEHGIFVYRETLQVPLMVKLPKSSAKGSTVESPVQLVDVFPTILAQTATPAPPSTTSADARSLLSFIGKPRVDRPIYSEAYYARFHFGWSDLHSLVENDQHFIRAPKPELYDLVRDRAEKNNTLEANRRTYVQMRTAIEPFVQKATAPQNIDPEEAAKLAALGYVGSTVANVDEANLPDPKDTIQTFEDIRIAFTEFRNNQHDKALALTNKLLAENKGMLDLYDLKSKILSKLGRNAEAIAAAKEGLKQAPNTIALLMDVANLSLISGELEQARQHAELIAKIEPAKSHEILSRVWLQKGDFEKAKAEANESLKLSHDQTAPLMALGLIEKQRGDFASALSFFDRTIDFNKAHPKRMVPNLYFYRGDVLAHLGRNEEAEESFRREIHNYPGQPDAYASLILLLSTEGRVAEATQLVFDLVKVAPTPPSYVAISETLKAIGDDRGAAYWAQQGLTKYPESVDLRNLFAAERRVLR